MQTVCKPPGASNSSTNICNPEIFTRFELVNPIYDSYRLKPNKNLRNGLESVGPKAKKNGENLKNDYRIKDVQ